MYGDMQGSSGQEEKIFVSVRLRPLNDREIARNGVSDWECINNNTIIFKSSMPDRSMFPSAYTFGKQKPNALVHDLIFFSPYFSTLVTPLFLMKMIYNLEGFSL